MKPVGHHEPADQAGLFFYVTEQAYLVAAYIAHTALAVCGEWTSSARGIARDLLNYLTMGVRGWKIWMYT
jgi:hypothetical protein